MSRAVMQQALEAMDKATRFMSDSDYKKLNQAIDDLRAALAEPEQEPVAWVECDGELVWNNREAAIGRNLYTAPIPRKPQPLTDEEIDQLLPEIVVGGTFTVITYGRAVARALERAHGIGDSK